MLTRERLREAYALPDRTTPRVRMNFVSSLDGAATIEGRSGGLGNEIDRRIMGVLRASCDVLLVGAGTVRAEGYGGVAVEASDAAWREAAGLPAQPRVAVVSRDLALSPRHPFFAEAVTRPILVTCSSAPADRQEALAEVADVVIAGTDEVDLAAARSELSGRGLRQVLCEGGPHLFGALLASGLVDEVCLTISPHLVGGDGFRITRDAPEALHALRLRHALVDGDWLFLRYTARGGGTDPGGT